jgi:hypothetical protein
VQEFRKSLTTVFTQLIYGIFASGIVLHYQILSSSLVIVIRHRLTV